MKVIGRLDVSKEITTQGREVLAEGISLKTGNVKMINTRSFKVSFPTPFKRIPKICLTFSKGPEPALIPYVRGVSTDGFQIVFPAEVTAELDWIAIESEAK